MKRRARANIDIFNMSFLDVVSCGFGAIILLLVMVKIAEPQVIEKISVDLTGLIQERSVELENLRAERIAATEQLEIRGSDLAQARERLDRLRSMLSRLRAERRQRSLDMETERRVEERLEVAYQNLSEEQKRLLGAHYRRSHKDATIGGVPVDSEYIIFIIDTSGSMQKFAWKLVNQKVAEVLEIYPRVKGIQVMNDMGDYMFSQYAGKWITDSPGRRRAILKRLSTWMPFSNSSPVEGIEAAIGRYYADDRKISLYIFGDDFARGSIEAVLNTVERLNRATKDGKRRVRIHAVGFPVLLQQVENATTGARFAALMRRLAETNNGSFVGLNDTRAR